MNNTIKSLALATAALVAFSAQAAVYSASPNATIPDNNATGISSTISVSDTSLTGGLTVSVGLNHSWLGDLIVRLTHGSTTVTLMDRPGSTSNTAVGDGSNLSSNAPLLFTMSASAIAESMGSGCNNSETVAVSAGCLNTSFIPEQSLAAFVGSSMAGNWTLRVSDNAEEDVGRLASWSLNLTPQANAVPEPGSLALVALSLAGMLAGRRRVQR